MADLINEYKLDCYQKIKPLGTGGNVWLVEDSVDGGRFVMHKLPPDSQKIYETLKGIRHPGIVEISDVFCHDGFLYVVEEYIDGSPLSDVITKRFFPKNRR